MKIGVTSQNFKTITAHAGRTRRFLIYQKNSNGELELVDKLDLPKEMSMHEFRGENHPIDEVDVLITGGCGNGFIQRMSSRGIKVVQTGEKSIATAVESFINGIELPPPEEHSH